MGWCAGSQSGGVESIASVAFVEIQENLAEVLLEALVVFLEPLRLALVLLLRLELFELLLF